MTLRDLLSNCIEIQGNCHYCYYDEDKDERIEITADAAMDLDIRYIYCAYDELYIEVESPA